MIHRRHPREGAATVIPAKAGIQPRC